ncbi:MAG: hypothetical protein PSV22_18100 [Pseudolabrys sp.]|nr:hypothetical protein [Pseudolabrys sp.]
MAATAPEPAKEPAKQRTAKADKPGVADDAPRAESRQMRTAFSAPASSGGLLAGAQPVVATGTFDSRWPGLR